MQSLLLLLLRSTHTPLLGMQCRLQHNAETCCIS